jgi:hypothetical protein
LRAAIAVVLAAAAAALLVHPRPGRIRTLPQGVVEVHSEMRIEGGTEVVGRGTVLRAAADFQGRAILVVEGGGVVLRDFTIDGNRENLEARQGFAPDDIPFARFTRNNGVLAEAVDGLTVSHVRFRNIAGFAVLVSRSRNVTVSNLEVRDSGSRRAAGTNNATGGILIEEGTTNFRVTGCDLRRVRGNGIWTHSLYTSARNARGLFRGNYFEDIGRDALQAGHATGIRIEDNWGWRIGYPAGDVDAIPVAIDTAGDVDRSSYAGNRFEDVNGKCIDLDGFHDGDVRGNFCRGMANYGVVMNNTNPDMRSQNIRIVENVIDNAKYGGIFVIGTGNLVARNRLTNMNTAHCGCYVQLGEPDLLAAGVYLGKGAERADPASGNTVEENEISGFGMDAKCVVSAPGVGPNVIRGNRCRATSVGPAAITLLPGDGDLNQVPGRVPGVADGTPVR